MKRFYPVWCCLALLFAFAGRAEIVTIDFQRVFEEYRELKEMDLRFRESVREFQERQQSEVEALRAKQQEFNELRARAARPEVTGEERSELADQATALLEELQRMERELQEKRNRFQKEIEARGVRLRRRVVDRVRERIAELAETRGWTLVIDRSARGGNGLEVVQYAAPERDVTSEVIAEINRAEEENAEEEEAPAPEAAE